MKGFVKLRALSDVRLLGLFVLNGALAIAFITVLISGTESDAILSVSARESAPHRLDLEAPSVMTDFETIQNQSLFYVSRSFFVAPPVEATPELIVVPDYRLAGVMALPQKPVSAFLVNNQTGQQLKVQRGNSVEGWTVDEVAAQRVVLSLNGQRHEIDKTRKTAGGLQAVAAPIVPSTMPSIATPQSGVRVLTGGSRASAGAMVPAGPAEDVGARLYRPPPGQ